MTSVKSVWGMQCPVCGKDDTLDELLEEAHHYTNAGAPAANDSAAFQILRQYAREMGE